MTTTAVKTAPARSLRYDAAESTLVITVGTGSRSYSVHYGRDHQSRRVVRLGKWDLSAKYAITLHCDRPATCDCPAGSRGRDCVHAQAVDQLDAMHKLPAFPVLPALPRGHSTAESDGF